MTWLLGLNLLVKEEEKASSGLERDTGKIELLKEGDESLAF